MNSSSSTIRKRFISWPTEFLTQQQILVLVLALGYVSTLAPKIAALGPLLLYTFAIARHVLLISGVSKR